MIEAAVLGIDDDDSLDAREAARGLRGAARRAKECQGENENTHCSHFSPPKVC
jgi:hypothetical protein